MSSRRTIEWLRFYAFWPFALGFWWVEKAALRVGNAFEDFATVDYRARRQSRRG